MLYPCRRFRKYRGYREENKSRPYATTNNNFWNCLAHIPSDSFYTYKNKWIFLENIFNILF